MEKRAKAIPAFITEEDSKSFDEIVNPIDRRASTEEKLRQMAALREEARPVFNAFIERSAAICLSFSSVEALRSIGLTISSKLLTL